MDILSGIFTAKTYFVQGLLFLIILALIAGVFVSKSSSHSMEYIIGIVICIGLFKLSSYMRNNTSTSLKQTLGAVTVFDGLFR